jgi:hypothetical protein
MDGATMPLYECPKCGKSYEIENQCCNSDMDRDGNFLVCTKCKNEVEIPSCCGEEMVDIED